MRYIKIMICGAHSTGKTTILNKLKQLPQFRNFTFIELFTREIQKEGYIINLKGDNLTQIQIVKKHELVSNMCNNLIADRCIIDGLVYTYYLYNKDTVTMDILKYAQDIFYKIMKELKYDYIYYIEPLFEILDDGVRSINREFRDLIVLLFRKIIFLYNVKVIQLYGSVENRINTIIETALTVI